VLASAWINAWFWVAISARWVRYASAIFGSSVLNAGIPCRGADGKYVPAKKGVPSGMRTMVSGQPPPRRVRSWCAVW
jgi:hypothetical protein